MSSEDSEDEPLSSLATPKLSIPKLSFENQSENFPGLRNLMSLTSAIYPNSDLYPPAADQRPDAWLYLKDLAAFGPYTCLLCSEIFINKTKMALHYILTHGKDYCGICRYFVTTKEEWIQHQLYHPWICSQCSQTHSNEKELRAHFSAEHNLIYCKLCHFMITNDDNYNRHLSIKHLANNLLWKEGDRIWKIYEDSVYFKCLICNKSDIPKNSFSKHYLTNHKMTLRCIAAYANGKYKSIPVLGANITSNFMEGELNHQPSWGHVTPNNTASDTEMKTEEKRSLARPLMSKVKLETLSDDDEESSQGYNMVTVKLEPDDSLPLFSHGMEDFDMTSVELVVLQKCVADYIENTVYQSEKCIDMKVKSEIDYSTVKAVSIDVKCLICLKKFISVDEYGQHLNRVHSVKTIPFYSCRICLAGYNTRRYLIPHIKEKIGNYKNLWLCQFCDQEFDSRDTVRLHLFTDHVDDIKVNNCFSPHLGFKCSKCPKILWSEFDRENHHKDHVEEFTKSCYKCIKCAEVFSENVFFVHHTFKQHIREEDFKCPFMYKCCICCDVLKTIYDIRAHFHEKHPDARKTYCNLGDCSLKPLSKGTFKVHVQKIHEFHSEVEGVSCSECGQQFATQRHLTNHVAQNHKKGKFKCKLCDARLYTADERKLHFAIRHPGCPMYECSVCQQKFHHKSTLYTHSYEHRAKETLHCSYCGKVFSRRDSYAEHLQIHQGPRHACSYCPRLFVQRSNMLRHERRHTGERPYSCTHCHRSFSDKGAANSHMRIHTVSEKFTCDHCGQGFVQKGKLIYHIRKHTGEHLEKCEVCSKIYTSKCSLKEHMKRHAAGVTINCPICDKTYFRLPTLQRHMKERHCSSTFDCPICGKNMNSLASIKAHILTHATKNMYRCKLCRTSYAARKSIITHVMKSHRSKIKQPPTVYQFYKKLDIREIGLNLDEDTINKYFGTRQMLIKPSSKLPDASMVPKIPNNIPNSNHIPNSNSEYKIQEVTVKCERASDTEMADENGDETSRNNYVEIAVKCEPMSDSEIDPTDFLAVKQERVGSDDEDQ